MLKEAVLSDTPLLETVHGFAGALCQWALRGEGAWSLPRWRDLYPGSSTESLCQPPWYLGYIQEVQDSCDVVSGLLLPSLSHAAGLRLVGQRVAL